MSGSVSNTSTGSAPAATTARTLPEIRVNNRQLRDIVADVWRVTRAANRRRPRLFTLDGRLVRLRGAEHGPVIQELNEAGAIGYLARVADWTIRKLKKNEAGDLEEVRIAVPPSKDAARDILEYPDPRLPILEAVVSSPVFDARGALISTPGYHPEARLWFHRSGFDLPEVPDRPTARDVDDATALLLDDLLVDFRFTDESDRAHALAALLLPFVRRMVPGCTPIHLVEAPSPGTGKGLMADIVSIVALGQPCRVTTLPNNNEEVRKTLTAALASGAPIISLDNVVELDSTELAAAVTANPYSARVLSTQRMIVLPNNAVWLATANNPQLSLEMARRCIRIRIDAQTDRPWERKGFKHDPLRDWARERRRDLVRAVLIWVQSWLAAGRPLAKKKLGSFEAWSGVIGGILEHVGIAGFLQDSEKLYALADKEGQEWREFVAAWWERFNSQWVPCASLFEFIVEPNELLSKTVGDKTPRSRKTRLGQALSRMRDRQFAEWRIEVGEDSHTKSGLYRLVRIEKQQDVVAPQLAMNLDAEPESSAGVYRRRDDSWGKMLRLRRRRTMPGQLWLSEQWEAQYAA
ncbi:hypothetical protein L6R52_06240 [Myxococcota bacterium]|nr:hypothetical protein [Myxococcota bacterium]